MLARTKWDDEVPILLNLSGDSNRCVIRKSDGSYDSIRYGHIGTLKWAWVSSRPSLKKLIMESGDRLRGASIIRLGDNGWPEEVVWTDTRDVGEKREEMKEEQVHYWVWQVGHVDNAHAMAGETWEEAISAWYEAHGDYVNLPCCVKVSFVRLKDKPTIGDVDLAVTFVLDEIRKVTAARIDRSTSPIELPVKA